jgi:hypothetical protein
LNYLVFSLSSHGTQVPDTSGDEPDRADEAFCTHDLAVRGNQWDPQYIIIDDELNDLFVQLPESVLLEVYLDTCQLHETMLEKGLVHHILWTGCRDDQTSADAKIGNSYHGAFTYYFCKEMRASNNKLSRSDILKKVRDDLSKGRYTQIPQLEEEATVRKSDMAIKNWTIMVYLAGDNDLDEDGARDIAEMAKVGSSKDVNIIAQFDRAGEDGTRRFYITEGGGYPKDSIENLGETNTGDPKVLLNFLTWGIKEYPAQHYMAVLWNHGSGWNEDEVYEKAIKFSPEKRKLSPSIKRNFRERGIKKAFFSTTVEEILKNPASDRAILYDDASKDFLDNMEMKKVLTEAAMLLPDRQFDILGFDACLMNTLEVAFQLKDTAKMIVGSEDSYIESYENGADSEPVTLSVINSKKIADVLTAVNKLALALKKNVSERDTFYKILKITYDVQQFYYPTYKDLFDFAKLANERIDVKEIKNSAQAVMDILQPGDDDFIVASGK